MITERSALIRDLQGNGTISIGVTGNQLVRLLQFIPVSVVVDNATHSQYHQLTESLYPIMDAVLA